MAATNTAMFPSGMGGLSDPEFSIMREMHITEANLDSGVTAATSLASFTAWTKMRLIGLRYKIVTAGSTSTSGIGIYNGSTVVGNTACGTTLADEEITVDLSSATNRVVSKGALVSIKNNDSSSLVVEFVRIFWQRVWDESES